MGNETSSGKVIAVILAVVLIVGGIVFFAMSGDDEESTAITDAQTSQDSQEQPEAAPGEQTIVELAQATPDLSTLVAAVLAADLVETLSGDGPFTVFAPTNEAFAALPAGTLEDLLKLENQDKLADILTYHVVAGEALSGDLTDGQKLKTVQGGELTVKIADGVVTINGAEVLQADVAASNGVVHVIGGVLLPQ